MSLTREVLGFLLQWVIATVVIAALIRGGYGQAITLRKLPLFGLPGPLSSGQYWGLLVCSSLLALIGVGSLGLIGVLQGI